MSGFNHPNFKILAICTQYAGLKHHKSIMYGVYMNITRPKPTGNVIEGSDNILTYAMGNMAHQYKIQGLLTAFETYMDDKDADFTAWPWRTLKKKSVFMEIIEDLYNKTKREDKTKNTIVGQDNTSLDLVLIS